MEIRDSHLGNQPVENHIDVISPSTGEVVAQVATSHQEHIEYALSTAKKQYDDRENWLSLSQRITILEKLAEIMASRADELAKTIAMEGGKPLADAQVEAARAINGIKKCIESISSDAGKVIPMGMTTSSSQRVAFTQKEPIGVVLAISAFNHPLNLVVHQVGAAISAGCPCIVKPSQNTPLSCLNFYEMFLEAGLPSDFLQVIIPRTTELSSLAVRSHDIQFLSFIGSARVGWMLRQQVQAGVRCALEHGGVAPGIVTANADIDATVTSIAKGGYYHAGQVCVSMQRVFVEKSIAAEVSEKLLKVVSELVVGNAADIKTEVGPLIVPNEVNRVESWVDEAVAEGATLLCGGKRIDDNFYAPTLLLNPAQTSKVSQMEIFGPVVCLYTYDNIDSAIAQANSLDVAFQASVFSENINECMYVYKRIQASAVMINDHSAFREDGMPFAGLKHSGLAVGGIHDTIHDMQIEKLMVIKSDNL